MDLRGRLAEHELDALLAVKLREPASITLTAVPWARAAAATSWPMKPAPMISSRLARLSSSRRARASSSVRSVLTLP